MRDNKKAPIKSKTGKTRRRKVMGLKLRQERDHDRQTADKSKTAKRRRRKARRLKPAEMLIRTDRLTERQTQGNLVTQSHGSNVTFIFVTRIARLPKSKTAGMTAMPSLLCLMSRVGWANRQSKFYRAKSVTYYINTV